MPLFASLTLVKETALKEAASLKSPLLTSFIEKEHHQKYPRIH